jgi:hypothetical protein
MLRQQPHTVERYGQASVNMTSTCIVIKILHTGQLNLDYETLCFLSGLARAEKNYLIDNKSHTFASPASQPHNQGLQKSAI